MFPGMEFGNIEIQTQDAQDQILSKRVEGLDLEPGAFIKPHHVQQLLDMGIESVSVNEEWHWHF